MKRTVAAINKNALSAAVQRMRDIVARDTGATLSAGALAQIEDVLTPAEGRRRPAGSREFAPCEVTVVLADLRGFTAYSASRPAATVIDSLNHILIRMSEIIVRHQGSIDRFTGDGVMALFGAPDEQHDAAERAVACATEMQIAMNELNAHPERFGGTSLYLGIGVNTGSVMAGLLGSELHSEYTVIGSAVNVASRIEALSLRGQVLISESTYERARDFVETAAPMDVYVKGTPHPIRVREVLRIPSLGLEVPRVDQRRSPRVKVRIPFAYQLTQDKLVMPGEHSGTIRDIGYQGAMVQTAEELAPHSEIRLELNLAVIGHETTEVYGKVRSTERLADGYWSGLEFTSVSVRSSMNIRYFMQLLIQGAEVR